MVLTRPLMILGAFAFGVVALRRFLRERERRRRRPDEPPVEEDVVVEVEAVPVRAPDVRPEAPRPDEVDRDADSELEVVGAPAGDEVEDPAEDHDPRHAEDAIFWSRLREDD